MNTRRTSPLVAVTMLALSQAGCGGTSGTHVTGYAIENPPTAAVAGDTLLVRVEQTLSDGTVAYLPAGTSVTWDNAPTITVLAPDSTADTPIPENGTSPTVFFVANPARSDIAPAIADRLFVRDAGTNGGTVTLAGTIEGSDPGTVTLALAVSPTPAGNATNGKTQYAASCAVCHGATGHGTDANPDGTFTIEGTSYDFPAPGLDAEDGNVGSDPAWTAAVFAHAARGDFDDGGVALRLPMPGWLTDNETASKKSLSTQDLADILAFMQTQKQTQTQ